MIVRRAENGWIVTEDRSGGNARAWVFTDAAMLSEFIYKMASMPGPKNSIAEIRYRYPDPLEERDYQQWAEENTPKDTR